MTPGEFQLYALGWMDANVPPDKRPMTVGDVKRLDAVRAAVAAGTI